MRTELLVVWCTFPDREEARQIGAALVERQVAACVTLIPGAESFYRWQGKIERSDEVIGLIKTSRAKYPQLESLLAELHPYEVPAILALPAVAGLAGYLGWLRESLADGDEPTSGRHGDS